MVVGTEMLFDFSEPAASSQPGDLAPCWFPWKPL